MQISSFTHAEGIAERTFTLADISGILWTPDRTDRPAPLVLLGHPGGLDTMYPRLLARARSCVAAGLAAATIGLPGSGKRPRLPALEEARRDLRAAIVAGEPVSDIADRLVLPLADAAVPEWQALIDAALALPEVDGPVGFSGGVIALAVRLVRLEPRISAAVLFAGSVIPRATFDEARDVTAPLHVLLQWDDDDNDRQASLDLFDAFASQEKTLVANLGGHRGVPAHAGEEATRFFVRHLRPS